MLTLFTKFGFVVAALWWALSPAMAQDRRVALVIGNAAYKSVSTLQNPVNDSRAVAKSLRNLGFEVIERENASREGIAMAVREYGDKLRGASVGLFYFAGHGVQVKGRNYLIPVDADIAREDEVQYRSFDVNEVLDKMDSARTPVNIVVLDACRNNPFARSFKTSQTGLAQMDAPTGTLIAFATAPGSVAQDGDGSNGLYTGALLKHIAAPGVAVEQMFKRVRVDVVNASKNQQVPWESSSLNRDFTFASAVAAKPVVATIAPNPAAVVATELALDLAFWDAVKDSRSPADYRAYLEQYPSGRFAALARVRAASEPTASSAASLAAPAVAAAAPPIGLTSSPGNLLRWKQGAAIKEMVLNTGNVIDTMAQSPENLYLAAASAGSVYLIDALRPSVMGSVKVYEPASGQTMSLQFSGDGRWLLLGQQASGRSNHQLIDVANKRSVWTKPSQSAKFDVTAPQVLLQNPQGVAEVVNLP
jgi:Caspase domain